MDWVEGQQMHPVQAAQTAWMERGIADIKILDQSNMMMISMGEEPIGSSSFQESEKRRLELG